MYVLPDKIDEKKEFRINILEKRINSIDENIKKITVFNDK